MKRREFVQAIPLTALLPAGLAIQTGNAQAETTPAGEASAGEASAGKPAAQASTGASGTGKVPAYADKMLTSDMEGLGPDGKPTGQIMTFTGASKANAKAEEAMAHKMTLTEEEQTILDGKEGEEKAKLMKILGAFGNTFGAEKLVDLGGAAHSSRMTSPGAQASSLASVTRYRACSSLRRRWLKLVWAT